jgi:beta-hydroxylase
MTIQSVLSTALAPRFWIVYVFLGSTLWMHFRGKVRHRLMRQVLGHTTITAPYNAFAYLFSAVPRTPVLDTKDFPELAVLRDNWQVIRAEALALKAQGSIRRADGRNDIGFDAFFKRGWTRFYLKW